MKIEVSFWGSARRLAGAEQHSIELPDGATVADLAQALKNTGALAPELPRCAFSIGTDLVPRSRVLAAGDEVAVLPPVSGG
jgi:molybdopterin converting factor small subunit